MKHKRYLTWVLSTQSCWRHWSFLKSEWNSRHCSLTRNHSILQANVIASYLSGRGGAFQEKRGSQYFELHVIKALIKLIGGIDHHYCCAAAIPSVVHHLELDVALHNPRRKRWQLKLCITFWNQQYILSYGYILGMHIPRQHGRLWSLWAARVA